VTGITIVIYVFHGSSLNKSPTIPMSPACNTTGDYK
jgi:hypothetical protein